MPFVNIKIIKDQVNSAKKSEIISKVTDLIAEEMNRDRELTNIVIDEISADCWALNGKSIDTEKNFVSFINIKVSKGTTNDDEMNCVIRKGKKLMESILGNHIEENYFIIDELNSAGWGFGDMSMKERGKTGI